MSHNFNPDTPNAPQDRHRIVRKLPVLALMIAATIGVLKVSPAWFRSFHHLPTKAATDTAPATNDLASARANDNCDPITLPAKTHDANNQASEKSNEVAVTLQSEKTPETMKSPSRFGHGEHVQSGASRKSPQGAGPRSIRKPQFPDNSPATRVYGTPSMVAATQKPVFYATAGIMQYVQWPDKTTRFVDPLRRDSSAAGSYR